MIAFLGLSPAWQRVYRVEKLSPGEVHRSSATVQYASGKATNAAIACRAHAEAVALATVVGGTVGSLYEADLFNTRLRLVLARGPLTRVCTTVVDPGGATEIIENAPPHSPAVAEELLRGVRRLAPTVTCGCGSLPEGVGDDVYARLVRGAGDAATVIDAAGPPLLAACEAGATVVKPNREELEKTVGRPLSTGEDVITAAKELRTAGAKFVLVTDGPRPAWLIGDGEPQSFGPPETTVISPIGAGDALCGRLAAALAEGSAVSDAVTAGLAAAAAHCGQSRV